MGEYLSPGSSPKRLIAPVGIGYGFAAPQPVSLPPRLRATRLVAADANDARRIVQNILRFVLRGFGFLDAAARESPLTQR